MPKPASSLPENQVTPAPELEKRTRRWFSTEYKLRIIAEADQCPHGKLGALLRREGLYSRQLQQWRRELANNDGQALGKTQPGPAPRKTPEQKRIEQLEKDKAKLERKLRMTEDCVALQKKALSMLDQSNSGSEG